MVDYVPTEKGQTVRQPSTANLMVDSDDRVIASYPYWTNFSIQKPVALMNGYFTRIGVTEAVLQWGEPTIAPDTRGLFDISCNGEIYVDVSIDIEPKWCTAQQLCVDISEAVWSDGTQEIADLSGAKFRTDNIDPGVVILDISGNTSGHPIQWRPKSTLLPASQNCWGKFYLNAPFAYDASGVGWRTEDIIYFIDPRFTRYIDIASSELTYAQDVKDASTQQKDRNVLLRWYLDWDDSQSTALDGFGFPILQGCRPFSQRRLYNPPKQIRWEPNLPIGNLSFDVYSDDGNRLVSAAEYQNAGASNFGLNYNGPAISASEFLLTLQVSEV